MNSELNPQTSQVRLVIADVDGTLVTQDKALTGTWQEGICEQYPAFTSTYTLLPNYHLLKNDKSFIVYR
jgi:hypothetical protein